MGSAGSQAPLTRFKVIDLSARARGADRGATVG